MTRAVTRPLDLLRSYIPDLVIDRLNTDARAGESPSLHAFDGALLFADISGFSALAERLGQRGPAGAEHLTRILNACFGALIDRVYASGGDIVKFAGDALLAVWPVGDSQLAETTQRAAFCALGLHEIMAQDMSEGIELSLRVSVGAGRLELAYAGGVSGRWDVLITGSPLAEMGTITPSAQPGEVILTPRAWEALQGRAAGAPKPGGGVRLDGIEAPGPVAASKQVNLSPELTTALQPMLPGAVQARLVANRTDWLAELRQLTVLFVNLPDLHANVSLERIQALISTLQTEVFRFEGSINKFSVDDKGVTLVAAFGLPPLSHEDDAARGVQLAFALQHALEALGQPCAIGVTSGRVFCGEVGNHRRREYTVIGDTVNLAARLMQAAPDVGGSEAILCDAATSQLAQGRYSFKALEPVTVKGKAEPVAIFRPVQRIQQKSSTRHDMIGRSVEREALAKLLPELLAGRFALAILEAEAGLGKSRLVADLLSKAEAAGIQPLLGAGEAIERSTPYHAWRPVFSQIFGLDAGSDSVPARRNAVMAALPGLIGESSDLADLLPLLNPVLGLDFPETPVSERMAGVLRADHTHQLLLRVLTGEAERRRMLLVMEDLHWFDSASLMLLRLATQHVRPLCTVAATRPIADPLPTDVRILYETPNRLRLKLESLSPEETSALVCQRLGVKRLPPAVAELIRERAEGHPFFSEELALSLRDAGLLLIEGAECRLAPDAPDVRALDLPNTIDGVITSRIDRLSPSEQLAIKVASVIGRVFALRTLRDIFPISDERPNLVDYFSHLEQLDLTPLESPEPDLAYIFKHIITQEVVYNLLLFSQRQQLHQAIAEWHERTYAQDLSPYFPLLAHHWLRAEERDKAVAYLERAGDQALQGGSYKEAVRFFEEAIATGQNVPAARRARWERQLGRANLGLNHILASKTHFLRALDYLGKPLPTRMPELIAGMTGQILRQVAHRLWPKLLTGKAMSPEERDALLEPVRIYENMVELYFFTHEQIALAYAGIRSLNIAERAQPGPQLAWAYALVSMLCGAAKAGPWSEAYERRARAVELSESDLATRVGMLLRLSVYRLMSGQWDRLEATGNEALAAAEKLGDRRKIGEMLALLGNGISYRGEIARGGEMFARIHRMADQDGEVQFICWGSSGVATMRFLQGDLDGAMELLESVRPAFDATVDGILRVIYFGHLASGYLRQGKWEQAWENARIAYGMAAPIPVTWILEAYFGIMEVCVAFLEAEDAALPAPRREVARMAKQTYELTRKVGRMFPAAEPQATYWQGLYLWAQGKKRRAMATLQKSLSLAQRLAMPYEEGIAHQALAMRLPAEDPARRAHLEAARAIFERIGARARQAAVEAELSR